ncbi:hypothetical protein THIOM_003377 [Candidatus Thiomargarita nelsonii]|uniref:Uncharacterized protein n=1 Tax=Candidatus Thiomargarita nelsonii TaxID=1003181 RepID=A0A176RYW2_9GAMM|nr:hypothetical protein THIOM_003377 [Candidatus Thiomargarita nelsonii]
MPHSLFSHCQTKSFRVKARHYDPLYHLESRAAHPSAYTSLESCTRAVFVVSNGVTTP